TKPHESSRRGGNDLRDSSCGFVDESLWRIYANTLARSALWRANVVEEPWLHFDRRPDAGARHRREYGDLQRHQRGAVERVAVSASGATGDGLVRQPSTGNPR